MAERDPGTAAPLDAGPFGPWLADLGAALSDGTGSAVPCGTCTACCTASQFVHIGPDETDTLARIPRALRFPAPGLPRGHVLLGYDAQGHCPMLVDGACSIYDHRPRTCRTYDCRVFPATGLAPDLVEQAGIARQAARWRFRMDSDAERVLAAAVQAAAVFLADHRERFPAGLLPTNPTQLAVLALEIHPLFAPRGQPSAAARGSATDTRETETDETDPDPAGPEPDGPGPGPELATVVAAVAHARDRARARAAGR